MTSYSLHARKPWGTLPEELWQKGLPSLQAPPKPPHLTTLWWRVDILTSLIISLLAMERRAKWEYNSYLYHKKWYRIPGDPSSQHFCAQLHSRLRVDIPRQGPSCQKESCWESAMVAVGHCSQSYWDFTSPDRRKRSPTSAQLLMCDLSRGIGDRLM